MIKAITFDLWDTVFIDDTDEPKRKAAGKPTKGVERRELVKQFADKHQIISQEIVDAAYNAQDAAFRKAWHDQHVTWSVSERLEIVLKGNDPSIQYVHCFCHFGRTKIFCIFFLQC